MIKTDTRMINGREWSVTQWPGTKALDALFSLTKLVGKGMDGVTMTKDNKVSLDAEVSVASIVTRVIEGIGTSSDAQKLLYRLLSHTRVDGKPVDGGSSFDVLFAGSQLFDLAPGLRFVLEHNFGDFFQAAKDTTGQSDAAESGTEETEA